MLYIHQFPDWTRFRYDSRRVMDALGQTRLAEGRLIGILEMCRLKDFESVQLAEDIVANYAIDGHSLSTNAVKKDVELLNQGKHNFIKNYIGAIQNSGAPLTLERICNWHAAMGQNKVMQFRNEASEVSFADETRTLNFAGPNPERLQNEMEHFLTWFEAAEMDGVIKAAIAHFWFLTLRPFADANGRLARTITAMQLARAEQSSGIQYALNVQILENRIEYFRILAKTQAGNGDLTEWILWFLKMMQQAISRSEQTIAPEIRQIAFGNLHAGESFSERAILLMKALQDGSLPKSFTSREAAALFGTSHDTAHREIQILMDKGILQADKKGGRSQRYSLVE